MKTIISALFCCAVMAMAQSSYAFETLGFVDPYIAVVDGKTGSIYVSSMNGAPDVKDDNGFISRLKPDGTIDLLRFIDGTSANLVLNSPKGMAVLGNFLYVCDIDELRTYNVNTGMHLFEINFGDLPRQNFYSITVGPDGALYVADAGVNRIYRIDISKQYEVTLFAEGDELGRPHGIVWHTPKQNFVVTGGSSGQVIAYDKSGKRKQMPAVLLKSPEGVDVDDNGNIYVADRELKSVYRLDQNFILNSYKQGLEGPTGVAYNRAAKDLIVTVFGGNLVKSFPTAK